MIALLGIAAVLIIAMYMMFVYNRDDASESTSNYVAAAETSGHAKTDPVVVQKTVTLADIDEVDDDDATVVNPLLNPLVNPLVDQMSGPQMDQMDQMQMGRSTAASREQTAEAAKEGPEPCCAKTAFDTKFRAVEGQGGGRTPDFQFGLDMVSTEKAGVADRPGQHVTSKHDGKIPMLDLRGDFGSKSSPKWACNASSAQESIAMDLIQNRPRKQYVLMTVDELSA